MTETTIAIADTQTELSSEPQTSDSPHALFRRIAIYFGQLVPTGTLRLSYVTEGAANVIWNVHFENSNLSSRDSTVVLRMRKDIQSTVSMTELKAQFEQRIAPLFAFDPSLLFPMDVVLLCPAVLEDLNNQLTRLEETGKRKPMRRGIYHPTFATEPYAALLPNLDHGQSTMVEFKPKWLVQSPSAPRDAQRCRTCALNARRRVKGAPGRGDMGFCPFDLLSRNRKILSVALRQVWTNEDTLDAFLEAFRERVQPALRQLQRLQRVHGEVGLDDFRHPSGKDFSVAMALRDCSVALKVLNAKSKDKLEMATVKLIDLDLKDAGGGKLAKWAKIEAELIDEGWYTYQPAPEIQCAMAFQ